MAPAVHLLLLPLLLATAGGTDLEEKKGPLEDTVLNVPEGTPVPYPMYQFQVSTPDVTSFRLQGEGKEDIRISREGWLFLERPLEWSRENHYVIMVEALAGDEVVEGPIYVTIHVVDVNNNAPYFNQTHYMASVRENRAAGVPFTRVFALDRDDPETPNAELSYSIVSQIPNKNGIALFQIDPHTGQISTTQQGQQMIKSREGIHYGRGEDQSIEALKTKFNDYCQAPRVPYEENPFFTCVERAEMRRRNVDPLEDPDYTLIVRVQDLGGESDKALSGSTRVHIVVQQNMWLNPGPLTIREHLEGVYPMEIAKVQSNDPDAVYKLVQKERELKFPFHITDDGEVHLTEELDREEKDMYILVVMALDPSGNEVDPPMEIQVLVEDVNDNTPMCEEETVFEVQEGEPVGSLVGQLVAHDADEEGTMNSQLTYTIESQQPPTSPEAFSIDAHDGRVQALRSLQRNIQKIYHLNVRVNDPDFSTDCKVVVKVIDVNNEMPQFEKNDYGSETLAEDSPVGHTVLTIRATDDDDPDSGSSFIQFNISAGNHGGVFAVETDGKGVGHLVIARPLDFESAHTFELRIDARNPEPLMPGLEYGSESTAVFSVSLTDVDEAPEFSLDILDITVPENTTKGSALLTVEAHDPEGKEIRFKLEGDTRGWLEIDPASGQIKTKDKLDRETQETFEVTVTAFEKDNPQMSSDRVVSVRLLDVNDNVPKLVDPQAFICVKKPEPVIIRAHDTDEAPFGQPFTFTLGSGKKSPNWDLVRVDDTSARLTLKKMPTEDKTFMLPINVKDHGGLGVTQAFEVRVCNCTELGYCYTEPAFKQIGMGMGPTVGILVGVLGFCVLTFVIVIKRSKKDKKKKVPTEEEERL